MTLYYIEGKEGWTTPTWNGYPTATWDPNHVHSYTAAVTDPTCTEQGYTTYTCECGDSYVDDYVDALGHDYRNNVCTRCGAVKPVPTVTFTDVPEEAWFKDSVTREQTAVFFHRFAKQMGYDDGARAKLSTFPDVSKVSEYAADSMARAVKNGILSGNSINGTVCLDPQGSATRAQGAAIMVRFYNSFVK